MEHPFSLLSGCASGGCGAKMEPQALQEVTRGLPAFNDPRLLVGYGGSDDAAVYQLDNGCTLASTVDFFPPMVEDARTFGRIVAANAMSDIWAMGGTPFLALNLVCYPEGADRAPLAEMLAGGAEKIAEAGAALGGGHTIYDRETKYGLAVTGLLPDGRYLRNNTPNPGDALILTKALGTGIVLAAHRVAMAAPAHIEAAIAGMERLNRYAAEKMQQYGISACTDVTGFGLLCHLAEMAAGRVTLRLHTGALPVLPGATAYAEDYLITAAGQRNREHLGPRAGVEGLPFALQELLFDPQTSGGLLIALPQKDADALVADIRRDDPAAAIIGEVLPYSGTEFAFDQGAKQG